MRGGALTLVGAVLLVAVCGWVFLWPVRPPEIHLPSPSVSPSVSASASPWSPSPSESSVDPDAPPPDAGMAYYRNCDEVRRDENGPLRRGDPGYRPGLDRDGDGVACDEP